MLEVALNTAVAQVSFRAALLQKDYYVRFSDYDRWPDHVQGKLFRISQKQEVEYLDSYTLPGNDYKDINLSNQDAGIHLYPDSDTMLTELIVAFKPGKYLVEPMYPAGHPIYRMDYSTMIPDVTNADRRWLGTWKPESSPIEDPKIKFYLVNTETPIIFRTYVLPGVDFEKCIFYFLANRCNIGNPIVTPTREQIDKSKLLYHLEELKL